MKTYVCEIPADGGGSDYVIFNASSPEDAATQAESLGAGMPPEEFTFEWLEVYYRGAATLSTRGY
jgi:hypothetical protein